MSVFPPAFSPLIAKIEADTATYDDYADALDRAAAKVGLAPGPRAELLAVIRQKYPTEALLRSYLRGMLAEWRRQQP